MPADDPLPADHVSVRPNNLVSHASAIEAVARDVTTAQQAGQSVQLDVGAYGQLCTTVPALLDVLQSLVVDGIGTAAASLRDTGVRLRSVAAGYQTSDQASSDRLTPGR